ncbi:MAG: PAS domain-containing protein [Bacteroidia bacterium]|nr:PAS domain-containing protein [Bacteroidia bacterium]
MGKVKGTSSHLNKDLIHYGDLMQKHDVEDIAGKLLAPVLSISDFISEKDLPTEIFNHLPGIIYITDFPSLSVLWLNYESFKTLGYTEKQIKEGGDHFFVELLHPEDLGVVGGVVEFFRQRKGDFFRSAYRLKHADGHYIWFYGTSRIMKKHENGDPMLLIGFAMDIFSQIHSDNKLRELLHENLQLRNKLVINSLTNRQKEIMILIAKGNTSKQIGERLNISSHTVETHRKNILKRLNFHNSAAMVKFTMENLYSED